MFRQVSTVALVVFVGLGSHTPSEMIPATEVEVAGWEALIVPKDASGVERGHGAYGSFCVSYGLAEEFPARNTLQRISSHLSKLGWVPLKEDWLNPGLPSSHVSGWDEFRDMTSNPPRHVHHWLGQWQDLSGNVVIYSLRYSYPQGGPPDMHSLWINGSWYPKAGVKLMRDTPVAASKYEAVIKKVFPLLVLIGSLGSLLALSFFLLFFFFVRRKLRQKGMHRG